MAIFGSLITVRSQLKSNPAFDAALDYLERCLTPGSEENQRLAAMQPGDKGRAELAHGAFAMEACAATKPPGEGRWESHKAYIDVQAVVSGAEIMEVADIAGLAVTEDQTPEKDLVFYQAPGRSTRLLAESGFIAVFFPEDGHRPSQALDAPAPVCKVVVKVPV